MPQYEEVVVGLAKRVQQLRTDLRLTQAALAGRAGVTVETVARLERVVRHRSSANSNPSLETLLRLATALEVELYELLVPKPVEPRRGNRLSPILENASPAFTQRLVRVAEALFREEQEEARHSGSYAIAPKSRTGSERG